MALSSYSELQTTIASYLHRSDLTTEIQDFIRLCESDMQVRARLSQWDTSASVSFTTGTGALPSDFAALISLSYAAGDYVFDYMPQAQFDTYAAAGESGEPEYFTIRGANILVYPLATVTLTLAYTARFTVLADTATSNSLLTLFPDAYLHGSIAQAGLWLHDEPLTVRHQAMYEAAVGRIKNYVRNYQHPHGLQMRVA